MLRAPSRPCVGALAIARGVVSGRRLRIHTTVVETHIHYPTDSSLLADGVRVLTRTITPMRRVIDTARSIGLHACDPTLR